MLKMEHKYEEFGKRLKVFRISLKGKVTQTSISKELGIKQTTYCAYENGSRKAPLYILKALEYRYNLNIDWLNTGEGNIFKEKEQNLLLNLFPLLNETNKEMVEQIANKLYLSQLQEKKNNICTD